MVAAAPAVRVDGLRQVKSLKRGNICAQFSLFLCSYAVKPVLAIMLALPFRRSLYLCLPSNNRTLRELAPSLHPSAPPAPSDPWPVPPDAHSAAAAFSSGSHPTPTLTELVEDARRKMVDPACRFPWLSLAAALAVPVEQPAGSALFVPSGWTHMVLNTEDTLSLNHNWVNGFNAGTWAARLLLREYRVAYDLLEDCRFAFSQAL